MKRVICLLLSAAILASCSETAAEPSGETTAPSPEAAGNEAAEIPETEKPDVPDNLPDVKYDGYTFRAVTHSEKIGIEEETGEALNDAMFRRDKAVEERFDVTLVSLMENDGEAAVSAMKRSVTAGTDDYDCGFLHMVSASNASSGGYSEARLVQVKDTSVFYLCEFSVCNCVGEGAA